MVQTVLIVDDDPECVRLLTLLLEREGFRALSVFRGEEAIRTLENEMIDLVSLDVILPDVNGLDWELYRIVPFRSDSRRNALPLQFPITIMLGVEILQSKYPQLHNC